MTCKLYLVPEDVINTWRSEQRERAVDKPVNAVTSQIDSKMNTILNKDMPDYDKEILYAQELEKMRTLRNKTVAPIPAALSLSSVPAMFKKKAEGLLDYIKSSGDISWDDKGQLTIAGQLIEKSHILDLIHDAVRFRKSAERPEGWRQLSSYLHQSNVPRELVGNPAWITKGDASSDATVTPESEFDSFSDDSEFHDATDSPAKKKQRKVKGETKIKKWLTVQ